MIDRDHIRVPLRLRFETIEGIVAIRYESSGTDGWQEPTADARSPSEVRLPFNRLYQNDSITLSVICEQSEPTEIVPTLTGHVAGVSIVGRPPLFSASLAWAVVTMNLVLLLLTPVLVMDSYLHFSPLWTGEIFEYIMWIALILTFTFFVLTPSGRKTFLDILSVVSQVAPARQMMRRWRSRREEESTPQHAGFIIPREVAPAEKGQQGAGEHSKNEQQ
jgi:hypothetical protein